MAPKPYRFILSRSHIRILDFSVDGGKESHAMALSLFSWADFRRVLHHLSSRTRLKRSWGQVWQESKRKSIKTEIYISVSYDDRYELTVFVTSVAPKACRFIGRGPGLGSVVGGLLIGRRGHTKHKPRRS